MIASRSAFSTSSLDLARGGLRREEPPEPRAMASVRLLDRGHILPLRGVRSGSDAHQLLLTSPVREAGAGSTDRRAHVVEMALLPHGRSFPAGPTTPSGRVSEERRRSR